MPKVNQDYLEARREKILDAAVICFARNGFTGTTIPDICQEAQLSTGSVYRYFPSKEDIIEASVQRYREDRATRLAAAEEKENIHQTLSELMDAQARRWFAPEPDNNMKVMLHSFGEALHNPQVRRIVGENWEDMNGRFEQIIRKAQEKGEINPGLDASAIAVLMNAIHDGLFLQRVILSNTGSVMEKVLEVAKALFLTNDFWSTGDRTKEEERNDNKKREPGAGPHRTITNRHRNSRR